MPVSGLSSRFARPQSCCESQQAVYSLWAAVMTMLEPRPIRAPSLICRQRCMKRRASLVQRLRRFVERQASCAARAK